MRILSLLLLPLALCFLPASGKNIVILCDGTGQRIKGHGSNILKFFQFVKQNKAQRVYYDPGLGTMEKAGGWDRFKLARNKILGLATGMGIDEDILQAYRLLVEVYEDGDKIFLFGFSRGAYTVRALAGMIYLMGLLKKEHGNLAGYALVAYRDAINEEGSDEARKFHDRTGARDVPIHFVGAFDTVSSLIEPNVRIIYLPTLQKLRFVRINPGITHFRHACAIDERRRMFRLNEYVPTTPDNILSANDSKSREEKRWGGVAEEEVFEVFASGDEPHTTKQVWFPGTHGDVGGGRADEKSDLAKLALLWMVDEAVDKGLLVDQKVLESLTLRTRGEGGIINESMTLHWLFLEFLPKMSAMKEWKKKWSLLGFYFPLKEPRPIPQSHELHPSVLERREKDPSYRPVNVEAYLKERNATAAE